MYSFADAFSGSHGPLVAQGSREGTGRFSWSADQRSFRRRDAEDLQHHCVLPLRENIIWPADAPPQGGLWAATNGASPRWRLALVSRNGSAAGPRKPGTDQDNILDALVHGSISHLRGGVAFKPQERRPNRIPEPKADAAAQLTRVFRAKKS